MERSAAGMKQFTKSNFVSMFGLSSAFFGKFYVDGDSGCWIWERALTHGYGQLTVNGRNYRAHRLMYALVNKKSETDLNFICHTCDRRACINPAHLYEGDAASNARDRYARTGGYKLTADIVREIRKRKEQEQLSTWELAAIYGVSPEYMWRVLTNKVWRDI